MSRNKPGGKIQYRVMTRRKFYILSLTWGLLLTIAGLLMAVALIIKGYRPKKFGWTWHFEIGEGWGGFTLGPIFLCEKNASELLKAHEYGHTIQNCYFGPSMLLFILCSAARYHDRNRRAERGETLPPYDSWWFEGQATKIGTRIKGVSEL